MLPGGVTEVVWHFAAYLQIFEDISRERADYDGSFAGKIQSDTPSTFASAASPQDFDFADGHSLTMSGTATILAETRIHVRDLKKLLPQQPDPIHSDIHKEMPHFRIPQIPIGGAGGGGEFEITISRQSGGEQTLAQFHQINALLDDDTLLPGPTPDQLQDQIALLNSHAGDVLVEMAEHANDQIPQAWWMPQSDTGALAFVTDHDQDLVASSGSPEANSVAPGYYLNGVLQDPAPATVPDQITVPDFPLPAQDHGHALGQWADAGGNTSVNAAGILDLAESARTMIVLGDYFKTNAIFQTNSLVDHDHVSASGGTAIPFEIGGDQSTNIADFAQLPGIYASLSATFAGPQWNIDVVNGNYYDIHTFTQTNYLTDNDVLVQNSSDTHYEAISGANQLANVTEFSDGEIHYDLIIVAGAYHGLNVVFQNNVLLNSDAIKMLAADGVDPTQSVVSGNNTLSNTATIEQYGGDNIQPVTSDLNKVVDAVEGGQSTLDPSYGNLVDGSGGTFNVLYVTGDYYDINAIWQTNVTSDVNVILQMLGAPSAGAAAAAATLEPGASETQSVTTGNNTLSNDAVIIDVAPTNTYVNGQVYGDTILVQANLLPTDGSHVVSGDTQSLVPELVAFLNESQEQAAAVSSAPATTVAHDDPMANVLH